MKPIPIVPEIINEMQVQLAIRAKSICGMSDEHAATLAVEISIWMQKAFGGQLVYIPKGIAEQLEERNAHIWSEFNGRNYAELAQKFGVSVPWVYTIIKRYRASKQTKLF